MASPSQIVDYQRRCYEADNRETGIANLLHSRNRNVRIFDGNEVVLSGTVGQVPLPGKWGEEARKDCYQYRRDKTLVYGAITFVGSHRAVKSLGKQLCAPLVYFPCDFSEQHNCIFLCPDTADMRINFPVLTAIATHCGLSEEEVLELCNRLPPAPWSRTAVHDVAALLSASLPIVDFTPLSSFPRLTAPDDVKTHLEDSPSGLQCLPAAGMALLPNSPDTRGVLFELRTLAESNTYSKPLQTLLENHSDPTKRKKLGRMFASPSVLSEAQQDVVASSRSFDLSLVVGPPGTGKSHTIATLAIDQIANGKTVLIASRMDQAVNVVADKLDMLMGPTHATVRAGRKEHLRELKQILEDLLKGIRKQKVDAAAEKKKQKSARQLARELKRIDRKLSKLASRFESGIELERAWSEAQGNANDSLFSAYRKSWMNSLREFRLRNFDAFQTLEAYDQLQKAKIQRSRQFLQKTLSERTERLLEKRRKDLSNFLKAIRARGDSKQQKLFSEVKFSTLLHAFPIWLCKLTDLSSVLPLERELFDLAILDEATQCDIASCLPLLQRARKVVVVGDPKQLRHLSFLSEHRQTAIANHCELDTTQAEHFHFRRRSILDAACDSLDTQSQVSFLDEHFRSRPSIIRFSNREFYENRLAIMRREPNKQNSNSIRLHPVPGKRTRTGRNSIEAERIVKDVVSLISDEVDIVDSQKTSIGVLSPFREQVDHLTRKLDKSLTLEQMEAHRLLVGTAHTFQGEERDAMFLSLAVDNDSHNATFRFLDTPNLLNVSITRARNDQRVYHSFDIDQLDHKSLLYRWLTEVPLDKQDASNAAKESDERIRDEIIDALTVHALRCHRDFDIGGQTIDLYVENVASEKSVALQLLDATTDKPEFRSIRQYETLTRTGLCLRTVTLREWQQDRERCLQRIVDLLNS